MNATLDWPHPIYIRLAKGGDPAVSREELGFAIGKAIPMRRARSRHAAVVMSTGVMTTNSLAAAELLAKDGVDVSVVHFHTIKPLDETAVLDFARDADLVVTVEENVVAGGAGSAVVEVLEKNAIRTPVLQLGLPDRFIDQGDPGIQLAAAGLNAEGIVKSIRARLAA